MVCLLAPCKAGVPLGPALVYSRQVHGVGGVLQGIVLLCRGEECRAVVIGLPGLRTHSGMGPVADMQPHLHDGRFLTVVLPVWHK